MKKIAFILILLIGVTAAAQRKPVPDTVLHAFLERYPPASDGNMKQKKWTIRFDL